MCGQFKYMSGSKVPLCIQRNQKASPEFHLELHFLWFLQRQQKTPLSTSQNPMQQLLPPWPYELQLLLPTQTIKNIIYQEITYIWLCVWILCASVTNKSNQHTSLRSSASCSSSFLLRISAYRSCLVFLDSRAASSDLIKIIRTQ